MQTEHDLGVMIHFVDISTEIPVYEECNCCKMINFWTVLTINVSKPSQIFSEDFKITSMTPSNPQMISFMLNSIACILFLFSNIREILIYYIAIISSPATPNSRIDTRKVIKIDPEDVLELHVILGGYLMVPTNERIL